MTTEPALESEEPGGAAFTCRFTAALRHVETTLVSNPVLTDHLAPYLCGRKALDLAQKELERLQQNQGPGKHLRVPARTRLIDDQLLNTAEGIFTDTSTGSQAGPPQPLQPLQVVSLGCGMDTRPWRLHKLSDLPGAITWFDVDMPEIAELKLTGLAAARAGVGWTDTGRTDAGMGADSGGHGSADTPVQAHPSGSGAVHAGSGSVPEVPRDGLPVQFPLRCHAYHMIGADLVKQSLGDHLLSRGYSPHIKTIWVLEAVIYYLTLPDAEKLLQVMAELSCPGSHLILTCVDHDLLEASRTRMGSSHIFANLWHFDHDTLTLCDGYTQFWCTHMAPQSTHALALSLLSADTYVALYGGAECVLTAQLKEQ